MIRVDSRSNTGQQIRAYVERVEKLHADRKELGDDIAEIFKEAKGNGFDVPALKAVIKRRAEKAKHGDKIAERNAIADEYEAAMGAE